MTKTPLTLSLSPMGRGWGEGKLLALEFIWDLVLKRRGRYEGV
jgi:hypothetical protein